MMFLGSCGKKDDNILSYSSDAIYLNCIDCGVVILGLPDELMILESEEQLEYAMNHYEGFAALSELSSIMTDYPIGEYIYIIDHFQAGYGIKVTCDKLIINKAEMAIYFDTNFHSHAKEAPTAISSRIIYAVLPKEYLNGYDFSNQQGVLYLGK